MIDSIVFDIGNVLLRFDFVAALQRIAPLCSVPVTQIAGLLEPLKMELESGRMGGAAFLDELAARVGFSGETSLLRAAWQEIFEPIEATHRLVKQWHGRYPMYLLSNTNDLHVEYFLKSYSVFSYFDGAVYSHEAGVMKPDAAIYARAEAKFGLKPERTLFIDDLLPNVEAARSCGWVAHHYSEGQHESLLSRVHSLELI
jgi:putative hydrolase of the HAD superfamily